ncbi:MAG: sugar phosphate isomerase/epimerase family protein [Pirellulales bacterium]
MRYAICNETFQDWPLEKACDYAAAAGYQGIEFAPFTLGEYPVKLSPERCRTVRQTIEQSGLECVGLHWLLAKTSGLHVTHPMREIRQQTVHYLSELAALCSDLGGRVLVFGSPHQRSRMPGVTQAQALGWLVETFTQLIPALESTNTILALEPLAPTETDVLNTADATCDILRQIDSPHIRLLLDVKAMSSEAKSIPEIITASRQQLEHFHANDENLQGPGFGDIEFMPILRALNDIQYKGWVSVEVFDYSPGIERLVSESISYMKTCMKP